MNQNRPLPIRIHGESEVRGTVIYVGLRKSSMAISCKHHPRSSKARKNKKIRSLKTYTKLFHENLRALNVHLRVEAILDRKNVPFAPFNDISKLTPKDGLVMLSYNKD